MPRVCSFILGSNFERFAKRFLKGSYERNFEAFWRHKNQNQNKANLKVFKFFFLSRPNKCPLAQSRRAVAADPGPRCAQACGPSACLPLPLSRWRGKGWGPLGDLWLRHRTGGGSAADQGSEPPSQRPASKPATPNKIGLGLIFGSVVGVVQGVLLYLFLANKVLGPRVFFPPALRSISI